jgi:predicted YcjX-like family ATPase
MQEDAAAALRQAADWARTRAGAARRLARAALGLDRMRIGVAGLSGAGKTVFTTSLVHALVHGGSRRADLPLFAAALGAARWRASVEPLPDLPPFPYAAHLDGLTSDPPAWPQPTRAPCGLRLELVAEEPGARRVAIEIVDYPGEWLLDLDLLDLDYAAWSAAALDRLQAHRGAAREAAGVWLGQALEAADDAGACARVVGGYAATLSHLRAAGLSFLQPGALLAPPAAPAPPPPAPLPATLAGGPLYRAMAARFVAYRDGFVLPFRRDHLARIDRQIVLVDLTGTLANGPEAFADARAALAASLRAFRYRRIPGLDALRGRIARVLVAATKIDHVATSQYLNARALLADALVGSAWAGSIARDRLRFEVLAAIRSTEDGWMRRDGAQRAALRGVLRGPGGVLRMLVPSDVPPQAPAAADWPEGGFVYAQFAPPDLRGHRARPFPNVNLDKALDHLVGDRLR